jgi:hypothetical protein
MEDSPEKEKDQARRIPAAYVCHQSPQRLRIKIASQRGNADYFDTLKAALTRLKVYDTIEVNALTGSVLLVYDPVDVADVAEQAKALRLFNLTNPDDSRSPMTTQLVSHLDTFNTTIRRLTAGEMDLPGILLLVLLISGFSQILRGNLRMPPWYTAFWYAFGIYKLASVIKEKDPAEK